MFIWNQIKVCCLWVSFHAWLSCCARMWTRLNAMIVCVLSKTDWFCVCLFCYNHGPSCSSSIQLYERVWVCVCVCARECMCVCAYMLACVSWTRVVFVSVLTQFLVNSWRFVIHICSHTNTHIPTHIRIGLHTYIHTHTRTHTHTHVLTHSNAHTHINTHTHAHKRISLKAVYYTWPLHRSIYLLQFLWYIPTHTYIHTRMCIRIIVTVYLFTRLYTYINMYMIYT